MLTFHARTLCPPNLPLSIYPPTPAHLFHHFARRKEHHWILRTQVTSSLYAPKYMSQNITAAIQA